MSRVVVCGSLNMDVVVQSARRPVPGETLLGATVSFLPGGKGLNQAVAALHATGEAPVWLRHVVEQCGRALAAIDDAASRVHRRLP